MEENNIARNRLKVIRMSHHLSQSQLAEKVGMKQSMINRIETQNANLTIQNAIKLCTFLEEPLENFWVETYERELEKSPRFDFLKMLKFWQLRELEEALEAELQRRYREQDEIDSEE